MNVSIANDICNIISELRHSVCNTDTFKTELENNLKQDIGAIDVKYTPNKDEGLVANVTLNIHPNDNIYSVSLVGKIIKSIKNATFKINPTLLQSTSDDIVSNIFTVFVIGPNSIVIQL